ncbi:MAG: hypothetical protein IMW88_05430 [Thermoflavifilum sp.]|uniref:hypothetical protein n=1 Tax=Thermoflavifilum sp. TaxID=1968839 RepID=UPI0018A47D95|nr:hypothetical protein [Thermoflavifilum sp.]QOR76968.1 MAG: hypothetical protein IMW88_05430 [Thermoflavifilum sp.]
MKRFLTLTSLCGMVVLLHIASQAQTNAVEFGQNRLQFKNFQWRYYQSDHFDVYFSQNGLNLGKFVAQIAEEQLPLIERFMDYGVNGKINIVVYNNFGEMKQSNIGIGLDWQNTGGITKLVNNKMIVYYNGDHTDLVRQIREGIARVIVENMLFGEDVGEFATNAVLLYLPKWFTDGYIAYAAQNWNADLDATLKNLILSGRYETLNQLVLDHPTLGGHAFWHYVEMNYSPQATSYLLYIARIERSLKRAMKQVLRKSYRDVNRDMVMFYRQQYAQDNRGRRQVVRGTPVTVKEVSPSIDYYHFAPRPVGRDYAYVEYKQGFYRILLYQGLFKPTLIYKGGVRRLKSAENPVYPLLAWDPRGSRLAVIYEKAGKPQLLIYDIITRLKHTYPLPFESVNSFNFLHDYNTLVLSAIRNGHSDIFTYNISNFKSTQLTNDAYDDLDPSYAAFPRKSGILFVSNRPSADAPSSDTVAHYAHYNVFMVSDWDNDQRQITQLTHLTDADARLPMQYGDTYFTFVTNENGIANRYAGSYTAIPAGVDSLFYLGSTILRNPDREELDSALADYGSTQPDSIKVIAITHDSTYTFPITNYAYGIEESHIAGNNQQISEVIHQMDFKRVYRLKEDTVALRRRNVSTRPTHYILWQRRADSARMGLPNYYVQPDTVRRRKSFFKSPFGIAQPDTSQAAVQPVTAQTSILPELKLIPYHLRFASDYLMTQVDNSVLFTQYQKFTGSGPVELANPFNGLIRLGVSDMLEDIKFSGGLRVPSDLNGSEYFFQFSDLKKMVDWSLLYYRKVERNTLVDQQGNAVAEAKFKTNLYQLELSYPLDEVKSVRAQVGARTDRIVYLASDPNTLKYPDYNETYGILHLEYVYDNTVNPATNIWYGLRYKVFGEMFPQLNKPQQPGGSRFTFNAGADVRYYYPIYRNFIWATRFATGFSWGTRKLIYYLGGVDNWLFPKFNYNTPIDYNANYAFQTLAENLRGYDQNIKNGNNYVLLNTELRLPVFSTFIETPINSDFVRNFQITSFIDIGTAWSGGFSLKDNTSTYYGAPPVVVKIKNGFLGPFAAGYGFGARSTIAGYFLRFDAGWPATGFFQGSPKLYLALGVDF